MDLALGVVHQLTGVVVMATNQPGSNAPPLQNSCIYIYIYTHEAPSLYPPTPTPAPSRSIALRFSTFNSVPGVVSGGHTSSPLSASFDATRWRVRVKIASRGILI